MSETMREPPSRHPLKPALFMVVLVLGTMLVITLSLYKIGFANSYQVMASQVVAVSARTDAAAGPRGEDLLTRLVGCTQCHGDALAGKALSRGEGGVYLESPSLVSASCAFSTPKGLLTLTRALRDGRDNDGRALWLMPQERIGGLCDDDIAAIAVALDARARVERVPEIKTHLTFVAYIRAALREAIVVGPRDEEAVAPATCPSADDPMAQGAYLYRISGCLSCHGQIPAWARARGGPLASEEAFNRTLSVENEKVAVHRGSVGERLGKLTPKEKKSIYTALKVGLR